METTLTLHRMAHAGSGPDLRNREEVYQYEVKGLPPGQEPWTAEIDHRWQILLVKDGVQGEWIGDYKSAEDALAALEEKVRNEFLGWK